jgi:hypothetical protein
MNGSSHPNDENQQKNVMRAGSLPQGLFSARRGKFGFRENGELKPPRERPRGGGGIYRNGGMGASAPIIVSKRIRFSWEIMRNYLTLLGLRPAAGAPRLR